MDTTELNTLNERFGLGGALRFEAGQGGLPRVRIATVEATAEIYFEEGELRQNATFQPTTEEKAAGFGK